MRRFTIYILAILVAFTSCTKDEYAPGNIDIEFQFESLPVDLNVVDNPFITCIVRSETGLDKVQMLIEMNDGKLVPYKTEINEFFNPRHCSIHERPVYTDDMTAFVVRATDLGGAVKEGRMAFEIKSKVNAPVITLNTEGIAFAEGEPIPQFSFSVSSDADLESVAIQLIQSATSSELVSPVVDFTDARNFEFDSSTYELNPYDINRIPQLIRIVAVDTYGKTSISTLKIIYRALPAPVVSLVQPGTLTEFEGCVITGTATSETGISKVECYTSGEDYEFLVASQTVEGSVEHDIAMTIPGDEIRDYITSVKVVVTDARSKVSEYVVPVSVNPVFEKVASGSDLAQEIKSRMNNAKYRTVKLELESSPSSALEYSIGSSRINPTKSICLKADPENVKPVVKGSAGCTFEITAANLDNLTFSFKNLEFQANSNSNADFFQVSNNGVSIRLLEIDNCILKTYKHSLIRTKGNNIPSGVSFSGAVISEIRFNNSIFRMKAPSDNGKALVYLQQTGDNVNKVSVTNSTFENSIYLLVNNMYSSSGSVDVSICNNTFVNTAGTGTSYFVRFVNGVKGTLNIQDNLFGGTSNFVTSALVSNNQVTKTVRNNYCTEGWYKETAKDLVTVTSTDAEVFTDLTNFDLTLKSGTTAYSANVGDPRWIK